MGLRCGVVTEHALGTLYKSKGGVLPSGIEQPAHMKHLKWEPGVEHRLRARAHEAGHFPVQL